MSRVGDVSQASVSFWYSQVPTPESRPPLRHSTRADVCIVGAGFTGLWTAYYLKKAQPSLRVVVLEQRFAGYGASGRNGGWLTNSVTGGREQYVKTHGREGAQAMQSAMTATVHEVIRVAEAEGIDADIVLGIFGAAAATQFIKSSLYNVTATDPVSFTGVAIFLTLVGFTASYLPARRAMAVDPIVALRNE